MRFQRIAPCDSDQKAGRVTDRSTTDRTHNWWAPPTLLRCGYGQSDVSNLPLSALDLDAGWATFPRPKTAVMRRCPLWKETIEAVRQSLDSRPVPKSPEDMDCVFVTKYGHRWSRAKPNKDPKKPAITIDGVAQEFSKVLTELGLKKAGSFYSLRHIHRDIAENANDSRAADYIMGHVTEGMADKYRERPPIDARLQAVVDAVREWLFPKPADDKPPIDAASKEPKGKENSNRTRKPKG